MSSIILAHGVHVATTHRADAPVRGHCSICASSSTTSPAATARGQTRGSGSCCMVTSGRSKSSSLARKPNPTLVDSNGVREIRAALRYQFDHTLIAVDDSQRDLFELLAERGVIDLRIMDNTGMEGSAAWVFDTAEQIAGPATGGRVWVSRVKARESRNPVVTLTAGPV